jgi:hypothetical protein
VVAPSNIRLVSAWTATSSRNEREKGYACLGLPQQGGVRVSGNGCNATGFSRKSGNSEAHKFNQKAPLACRHWCLLLGATRAPLRAGPWYVALPRQKLGTSVCGNVGYDMI